MCSSDLPPRTAALRHVYDIAVRPEFKLKLLPDPSRETTKTGYGVELTYFIKEDEETPTLKRYYGVSPYYFAYRAFQRTVANPVPPATTSMSIIDAWPAMSLRLWCRDDLYYTTGTMANIGVQIMKRPNNMSVPKALETIGAAANYPQLMTELRDCFENITIVAPKAVTLFQEHLNRADKMRWTGNKYIHNKHIKETLYYEKLGAAEGAWLEAFDQWVHDKGKLSEKGRDKFKDAQTKYKDAMGALEIWVHELFPNPDENNPDKDDYIRYAAAIKGRIDGITKLVETLQSDDPKAEIDLTFLFPETLEK